MLLNSRKEKQEGDEERRSRKEMKKEEAGRKCR